MIESQSGGELGLTPVRPLYRPTSTQPETSLPVMSIVRAFLLLLHAILYQLATTAPNKTQPGLRYDHSERSYFKMAPIVFKVSVSLPTFSSIVAFVLGFSYIYAYAPCPAL